MISKNNTLKVPVSLSNHRRHALKRLLDVALVLGSSPITLPVGLATAAAVRIKMGAPVFYRQERIGLDEKAFELMKFRSMLPEVDSGGNRLRPSQRITRFGKLLRTTSFDELPQLINVLRGDMSLVGPRPLLPEYLPFYWDNERARHTVRPGITGAAQVQGRNNLGWDDRLAIDAEYAQNYTLLDDVRIIGKTIWKVMKSADVSVPGDGAEFLHVHRSYPRDENYFLRRFERRDIPLRVEWFNHPSTLTFMRFPTEITHESTNQWLSSARKDPLRGDFVICRNATDRPLAVVGYRFSNPDELPVIYVTVDPDSHGRGIGGTAMKLLFDHMKDNLKLDGAAGEFFRENQATFRLNKRLGMVEVAADLPADRARMEVRWR